MKTKQLTEFDNGEEETEDKNNKQKVENTIRILTTLYFCYIIVETIDYLNFLSIREIYGVKLSGQRKAVS